MKEKIKQILPIFFFIVIIVFPLITNARSGCCSWHGGVCGCSCCDGTPLSATCAPYYPECGGGYYNPSPIPSCPSMSYYDSLSDSCKCYTGYVVSGDKCVSADQLCRDQYGVMAKYNSLYNQCECFVGYVFGEDAIGRNQCISEDDWCHNKYGYNSRYNILTDKCECKSGYEFTVKSGGVLKCESCFSKYGLYSSYNYVDKKCECDEGYILENNECVKQQITITCPLNSTLIGSQCICNSGYIASGSSCITYTQNCQNKYGSNSYEDKQYCYCSSGYEFNSDKTSCIKSIICPINSTKVGQSCICNEGFVSKNEQCISHTEDCRLTFGGHVIGHEGQSGLNNSNCDCEEGYIWNSSKTACVQIEPVSTSIVTTKRVTNTTKVVLEDKNQEAFISTLKIKAKNTLDNKFINSSTTESQKEENIQGKTQNWFTKTIRFINIFFLKLFK